VGYWESLDKERFERQKNCPWYKRDGFKYLLLGVAIYGVALLVAFLAR